MSQKSLSLHHIVRESSLKENAPALIMLHGYGSDENDLFSFASELPKELFIISVRAPYTLQPYGNAWYAINFDADKGKWNDNEQAKQSLEAISNFIDEVIENYSINKNNISLLGFSQGTILSYAVALSYPEKVQHVVALSGYINDELLPEEFDESNYKNLDFFISHGSVDQVLPAEWAQNVPPFLDSLNIKNSYQEYPVGHGVAPQNFQAFKK